MSSNLYMGLSKTSVSIINTALVDFSGTSPQLVAHHRYNIPGPEQNANSLSNDEIGNIIHRLLTKVNLSTQEICAIGHQTTQKVLPSASFYAAFFHSPEEARVIIHLGTSSMFTLLPAIADNSFSFDSGLGTLLLDLWINDCLAKPYDEQGKWASDGVVIPELLDILLQEITFAHKRPRLISEKVLYINILQSILASLPLESRAQDVQCTLTEFIAYSLAQKVLSKPEIMRVLVCAGGARNTYLLSRLANWCAPRSVHTTFDFGIPLDCLDAVFMAWLAREQDNDGLRAKRLHPSFRTYVMPN